MSCEEMQHKFEAYLDGELTLSDQRSLEEHLAGCNRCNTMYNSLRTLSVSIKNIGYTHAPASLRRNIKRGLKEISGEHADAFHWYHLLGVGGGSAIATAVVVWLVMISTLPSAQTSVTDELVAAHVRSMMVSHLTDVASSDQHTVKPWFNGKLDFAPSVRDLRDRGYPLVGGRLDYVHQQPVAALIYQHRAHVINVFIRRGDTVAQALPPRATHQLGYNLIRWRDAGLDYALVSDLNEKDLQELAGLLAGQPAPKS